jgi:hypothetical protein
LPMALYGPRRAADFPNITKFTSLVI